MVRRWPEDRRLTLNNLAQQLLIRHNSAVRLGDRLDKQGLGARDRGAAPVGLSVEEHRRCRSSAALTRGSGTLRLGAAPEKLFWVSTRAGTARAFEACMDPG